MFYLALLVLPAKRFHFQDPALFEKLLAWADSFPYACYLNPNGYTYPQQPSAHVLAVGRNAVSSELLVFDQLKSKPTGKWWFGYLGYDLKNELEALPEPNSLSLGLPDAFFFEPEILVFPEKSSILIRADEPDHVWEAIHTSPAPLFLPIPPSTVVGWDSMESYCQKVEQIRHWIGEGRVYEVNLCQHFEVSSEVIGLHAFIELQRLSPMPFGSWLKGPGFEIASASPERFLKKTGRKLLSQPIKGTAPRFGDMAKDIQSRNELLHSEKERAENLMIVDLVRNDLARVSATGSTRVDELFGIYSFPKVHQMISSVSSKLRGDKNWVEALRSAFPMGSMTGAPKLEAIKVIDELENYRRGAFSGALGYITPKQDFDFNVLIRSIFLNHTTKKAGFSVGSAITWDSDPFAEWNECAAKSAAILKLFGMDWDSIKHETVTNR